LSCFSQSLSTFKLLFVIALVPAILAVLVLLFIREAHVRPQKRENIFSAYKSLSKDYKHYLFSAAIFSLAYFSFGFLLLKAYMVGFQMKDVVLLYALFNVASVLVAAPIGKLGDYIGRKSIITTSFILYLLMSIGFIFASTKLHVILLFILFGVFYSIDEGQSKAFISDLERKKKGTAMGLYNFITGIIYLPASLIAGYLWTLNPGYAFIFAAMLSLLAAVFFLFWKRE